LSIVLLPNDVRFETILVSPIPEDENHIDKEVSEYSKNNPKIKVLDYTVTTDKDNNKCIVKLRYFRLKDLRVMYR